MPCVLNCTYLLHILFPYVSILQCILLILIPIYAANSFLKQSVCFLKQKGTWHLNPVQMENLDVMHHIDPVCDLSTPQSPLVCFLVLSSAGVIERWELLQAQAVREEQCYSRDREQLTSDLHDITSWLGQVIPEIEKLQNAETACVSVQIMEARVKQLKV